MSKILKDEVYIGLYQGKEIDLETALSIIGLGKYNYLLIFVCGTVLFAINAILFGVAYILPSAACDFELDSYQKGFFTGVSWFGVILSLYVWGALSDIHGRKKIVLISLIVSFVANLISTFTYNFWTFCMLQFLSGFFISGASSIIYAYLGEFHSNESRAGVIAWCTVFMAVAIISLPLLAWIILTQPFRLSIFGLNLLPWRLYLFLMSFPSILATIPLYFFPESPKHLLLRDKTSEVFNILKAIYVTNTSKSLETFPIVFTENMKIQPECESKKENLPLLIAKKLWYQTSPLFNRTNIKNTTVVCLLNSILFFISCGILWYPYILHLIEQSKKNYSTTSLTVCESLRRVDFTQNATASCDDVLMDNENVILNTIIGIFYIVGCSLVGALINLLGRRFLLVINLFLPIVCCGLLLYIKHELTVKLLFIAFLVLPGLNVGIMNSLILDIFPTQFRAMAVSLGMVFGRIGGALTATFTVLLLERSCEGGLYTFGTILIVGILFIFLLPNTNFNKNGR